MHQRPTRLCTSRARFVPQNRRECRATRQNATHRWLAKPAMKRLVLVAVILALVAGGTYVYQRTRPQQAAAAETPPVAISVVPVKVGSMADKITSYGNLVPRRTVNIVPDNPGKVKEILFTDGQEVAAGTPLVVMDTDIVEAQVAASRAQADADMQNLKRTQSLSRQGLDSTYSLEQAQARAAASASDFQINTRKLAQLTLRAPFAGRLGTRRVDAGAYLNVGETIVRLDDTALQVEFRVPSTILSKPTKDMTVYVDVPGDPSGSHTNATLTFIDPAVSTDTRSVLLRALVSDGQHQMRPGLYVRVTLAISTIEDALIVPAESVVRDLGSAYVYVVDSGDIARRRTVTVGLSDGDKLQLTSGVMAGDRIVTIGQFRLRDGDKVKVVPDAPAASKSAA